MSSGLFSSYINDGNSDYRRIKAKGGLLIDFDLDGDLDIVAIEKEGDEQFYIFRNDGKVGDFFRGNCFLWNIVRNDAKILDISRGDTPRL